MLSLACTRPLQIRHFVEENTVTERVRNVLQVSQQLSRDLRLGLLPKAVSLERRMHHKADMLSGFPRVGTDTSLHGPQGKRGNPGFQS